MNSEKQIDLIIKPDICPEHDSQKINMKKKVRLHNA